MMRAAAAGGDGRLPGRARLRRYVDHAGLRARRGQPRRPAAPLPDQERPGRRGRRAPDRGARRRAGGGGRAAADRTAAHPRGAARCSATTSPPRSSPRRSSCGSPPAPTRPCCAAVAPLEQRVGRETHRLTVELLGADESRPGVRELVQATLDLVRGLGLANTITDDARRRAPDPRPLGGHARRRTRPPREIAMNDLLDDRARRPRGRGRPVWSTVAGLDEDAWRTPTPAAGWDVAPQVAHLLWTDEVAVLAATDKEMWDAVVVQALGDPDGFVDSRGATRSPRLAPEALLARWGTAREALGRRCASTPRARRCLVRTADVADVDGDRAVHGDLGARPRRVPRRSASSPSPPTGSGTSPTSASAPATSRSPCTSSTRPTEEFRVELASPSGETWAWGPEDAAQTRDRVGVRLLPAGHPAHPPRRHRPGRRRRRRRAVARHRAGVRRTSR